MPPVVFHILSEAGDDVRYRQACQLAEQATNQNLGVFIRTADAAEAQRMDELLWTFSDRAFIPHEILNPDSATHPRIAVLIGEGTAPATHRALLINLAPDLPPDLADYSGVAEVVDGDGERKRLARERYKQYRERGCALETKS